MALSLDYLAHFPWNLGSSSLNPEGKTTLKIAHTCVYSYHQDGYIQGEFALDSLEKESTSITCRPNGLNATCYCDLFCSYPKPIWNDTANPPAGDFRVEEMIWPLALSPIVFYAES